MSDYTNMFLGSAFIYTWKKVKEHFTLFKVLNNPVIRSLAILNFDSTHLKALST